jgi:uridylate kinase
MKITMPKKTEVIVLKLSGSLFFSEEFERVVKVISNALRKKPTLQIAIVAGGGSKAREYIAVAAKAGADQATLDEIGIMVSRVNAFVLASSMGELSAASVPHTLSEVVDAMKGARAVVLGGLHPGQSTNAVGTLVAEKLKAKKFVNATDVDGVYTRDPRKFEDARRLDIVTPKELAKIVGSESMAAGAYDLMDPVALKLIERSHIRTWIVKCNAKIIEAALLDRKIVGTEIVFN